jgi:hypothetical protein
MSALPPKADICGARANLRCEPITTAIKFVGNGPPGQHERLLTLERADGRGEEVPSGGRLAA